jgi:probable rRNA maturation factor
MPVDLSVQACISPDSPLLSEGDRISESTWQQWFECWSECLADALPRDQTHELNLRLTEDRDIQALNARYRHQDRPTDVLAFAALEANVPQPDPNFVCLGDIVISVETASRQARSSGHSLTVELAWLAAHGWLHLLGWDHPDEVSLTAMWQQQEKMLRAIGLSVETQ